MLSKTSRATFESSCQWVISGAIPEARVPTAASTPIPSTSWCGFGSKRRKFTGAS
jgi:hypothetical protein